MQWIGFRESCVARQRRCRDVEFVVVGAKYGEFRREMLRIVQGCVRADPAGQLGSLVKTSEKPGCRRLVMGHVCDTDPLPWVSRYAFRQHVENSTTDQIRGMDQLVKPRISWE